MYFEKKDTSLEILIGAYTENPEWLYISKDVWLNTLNCVTIYYKKNPYCDEVLFEELFQSQDVGKLRINLIRLLQKQIPAVHFKTEYGEFSVDIVPKKNNYQVHIYIINRANDDIEESFLVTHQELCDIEAELKERSETYPPRYVESNPLMD